MIAEIIAVGSEMLTPHRQDTNSLFLTAQLNTLGVQVAFKTIVGDNPRHLTGAILAALARADVVVLSGGLGPTEDDLTRECVAAALGRELHLDPDTFVELQRRFTVRRIPMPVNNQKQADRIDGAEMLTNPKGSAPGQWLDVEYADASAEANTTAPHRKLLMLLPGVPSELKAIFLAECMPRLAASLPPRHIATRMLRMALLPESAVDARCAPIYKTFADVETTILAGGGEIQLHFQCTKPTLDEADARLEALVELIEAEMADEIFSSHGESLEEIVILLLGLHNQTLAVAESCTGGMISARLTSVVNASRSFHGGAIVYSNELKTKLCGVPAELIAEHGAVSAEVARALAEGIRAVSGCTLGVSITGIAGPPILEGPDYNPDAGKPAGLVYIGIADGEDTRVKELRLSGDRDRVRLFATMHALEAVRRQLQ